MDSQDLPHTKSQARRRNDSNMSRNSELAQTLLTWRLDLIGGHCRQDQNKSVRNLRIRAFEVEMDSWKEVFLAVPEHAVGPRQLSNLENWGIAGVMHFLYFFFFLGYHKVYKYTLTGSQVSSTLRNCDGGIDR